MPADRVSGPPGPERPARPLTVITGGSRGIGEILVRSYLAETDVLNLSRGPAAPAPGHALFDLRVDLADVAALEAALRGWLADHPDHAVRTLIHNAAALELGWLDQVESAAIDRSFRVNVHAPLAITRTILTAGRFAPVGARVIYVGSSLARPLPALSFAGLGLYSVTKAAVARMALIQAREFALAAPHVTVVRVHPGVVDTDLQRALRSDPKLDPAFADKTAGLPPYRDGDWDGRAPHEHMRTVSPELSAEFIRWAAHAPDPGLDEHDFYHSAAFHAARARR